MRNRNGRSEVSCRFLLLGALIMSNSLIAAVDPTTATLERSAIDAKYQWDLSKMYASQQDWETHYKQVDSMIAEFAAKTGKVGDSAQTLLDALKLRDQINVQLEKIAAFASLRRDEDMRISANQALSQRAETLGVKWGESSSWFQPELLKIQEDKLRDWLNESDLKVYQHYFDDLLRSKAHILSSREEELLAMSSKATEASSDVFGLLSNTELRWRTIKDPDGKEVEITSSSYTAALQSKSREYRRAAFEALMGSFLDVKSSLAATLAGAMQRDWFYSKARKYPTCLAAALDAENLPDSVYDNLVKTVTDHRQSLQRYVALKKRVLKLDQIHFYDLYVNLVDVPERHYSFDEARQLVLDGVKPFGEDYVSVMKQAFDSRWIDVYENKGKRSGGYNAGTYLSPPYVLLNFKGRFNDVSTVAHELGHACQSYFAQKSQPPVYSGYPMFTAEVASTAGEIVFKRFMLEQTQDRKERAFLINQMLEDMRGTIFRQTQFAEFDRAVHTLAEKGEPITAEVLMKICHEQYERYYGPDFVIDAALDVEGLRIPHYYRDYYVYRYADSYCAAAAIARHIMNGEPGAREQWMKFLKAGGSMYAVDMLRVAGVDMTTPKPIEDAMALFDQLVNDLEKLL